MWRPMLMMRTSSWDHAVCGPWLGAVAGVCHVDRVHAHVIDHDCAMSIVCMYM